MGNVKKVRINESFERAKTSLKTVNIDFGYILCPVLMKFLLDYY